MKLYFRIKENGATVFRPVEDQTRGRLDLTPIAEANVRNGAVKPRRDTVISEAETAEIEAWLSARSAELAAVEADTGRRAIAAINAAAHWYSGKPDTEAADGARDDLLMAMHDLRAAIVRYMADQAKIEDDD